MNTSQLNEPYVSEFLNTVDPKYLYHYSSPIKRLLTYADKHINDITVKDVETFTESSQDISRVKGFLLFYYSKHGYANREMVYYLISSKYKELLREPKEI